MASSATGTNTQEAGIDEPDVAKTDGRIVVRLEGQSVVVTDVSGATPRQLSTWTLPAQSHADGLLLVDGHVLLAGDHGRRFVDRHPPGRLRRQREHGRLRPRRLRALHAATGRAHDLVGRGALPAPVRRHGPPGHLDRAAGPAVRGTAPGAEPGGRDRPQPGGGPPEHDRAVAPLGVAGGGVSRRAVDCSRIYHPALLDGPARDTATIGIFTLHPGTDRPGRRRGRDRPRVAGLLLLRPALRLGLPLGRAVPAPHPPGPDARPPDRATAHRGARVRPRRRPDDLRRLRPDRRAGARPLVLRRARRAPARGGDLARGTARLRQRQRDPRPGRAG